MARYIVLLRGINVGGKNKISMPELKSAFEKNGFTDVLTYINSGNIIVSTDMDDVVKLKEKCERLIEKNFNILIPVIAIAIEDFKKSLNHAPSWWGEDTESKHNGIFIIPPTTVEEVFKVIGDIKPEYEKVDFYGNLIFWSAPIKTFSRTRWIKIVGSTIYNNVTIRNANTIKKLLELSK